MIVTFLLKGTVLHINNYRTRGLIAPTPTHPRLADGCNHMRTPHLDALAAESLSFDNAYVAVAWCSPSRTVSAFMLACSVVFECPAASAFCQPTAPAAKCDVP